MNEITHFSNIISSMEKAMKLLRKKSVLLLVVMSFTIFDAHSKSSKEGPFCDGGSDEAVGDSSSSLEACIRFTNHDLQKLPNKSLKWETYMKENYDCCNQNSAGTETKVNPHSNFAAMGSKTAVNPDCQKKVLEKAQQCASIANILESYGRDWSNPEHTTQVKKVATMNAQQANGQQTGTSMAGSNISCSSQGIETVDYEPCKKFVDTYTAAEAATQMVHAGQSVMLQGKLMDVEADMIKNQNSATGALEAQAKGMKEQANIYSQRAALDASKLGVLYTLYEAIPKAKDLTKTCQEMKKSTLGTLNGEEVKITEQACTNAISSSAKFALLQNQAALDAMKAQLMTAAVSTANNAILSKLTNDRAKEAKKAIADINEFQPTDPFTITTTEEETTLCETDPTNTSCTSIGLDANYDAISDNTIVFGSTGSGSTYTGGSASDNEVASGSTGTSSSAATPTIGSVIAEVDKSGDMESSAAATVSSKANGGAASGSGGGAGGGAGALGGQTPQKAAEGGVASAVASKVAAYSGGEGFSVTGGLGIKAKKSGETSDENPFGKLFGKDGKTASDVNFRDIASTKVGAKGDNIFDMISKRYGAVNSEKRLVEYELAR